MNVSDRGINIATFRWIEVRLMETLAQWVPTTPEMEVKLVFGAHIWDTAQHADALGKRTQELRLPEQHSIPPAAEYVALLDEVAAIDDTSQRVAAFYDCILPGLERRYRRYLDRVDQLLDAPTVRIIERILADTARMKGEAAALTDEVPAVRLDDASWLDARRSEETAIPDVVGAVVSTGA